MITMNLEVQSLQILKPKPFNKKESKVMDYEFEMEKPFILTTADMLEIAANGGNGSEYVDIIDLMENAAKELREKDAEIERLQEQAYSHNDNGLKKDVEIERLREKVNELVKERNRYKRVCLKIVGDSKEESDISDFVLYLATEALKEKE